MSSALTAVIITGNEERNIKRCIDSLLPVVDEVVVLDSFSTDQTPRLCQEYTEVRFVQHEWLGYAQAKNLANSMATNDWVISIDADECLSVELQESILKEKSVGFSGVYALNRLTNYCGKWIYHSGWYPDVKTRIFNRLDVNWIGEFVHEELNIPTTMTTKQLVGHLHHYSYYDAIDHLERANRYSLLTAKKLHAAGKRVNWFKPGLSALGRFIAMYILKRGFLDGRMGLQIAAISAKSNVLKYRELRRLNKSNKS